MLGKSYEGRTLHFFTGSRCILLIKRVKLRVKVTMTALLIFY